MLEVAQLTVLDPQVARGSGLLDGAAEDGDAQLPIGERPVHVEGVGVRGLAAELQEVPPPGVLRGIRHARVVRHDVDEDAAATTMRGRMR